MAWTSRPAPLEGLFWCLDDLSRWCSRAIWGAKVCSFHNVFTSLLASVPILVIMHSGRHWPFMFCIRLLEACSWEHSGMPARVHLGMLLGAISGLKMRSSRKAFTGSVTRRFPSLPNFW